MMEAIERRYTILKHFASWDPQSEGLYKAIKALDEGRDIRKEHLFPSLTPIPYYLPSFALPSSPYHNVHLAIAPLLEFQEDLRRGCFFEPVEVESLSLHLDSPELLLYGELPPEEELLALLPACRELRMPELEVSCWSITLDEDKLFSYPPVKRRYI